MHRFYLESTAGESLQADASIRLPENVSHQIRNVLRLRADDRIVLFKGDGTEWTAVLDRDGTRTDRVSHLSARLVDCRTTDVEMRAKVTMAMALTRPQRYELALAKCTELGAHRFVPVISERVLKADRVIGTNRRKRWRRITVEAAELSGRVRVPEISEPMPLVDVVDSGSAEETKVIFLWERTNEPMLADLLNAMRRNGSAPEDVIIVLGPVGGFSVEESNMASERGAIHASLGPRVLRTETASIAAMALAAQVLE